jgi:anti-sigma factor RsiW
MGAMECPRQNTEAILAYTAGTLEPAAQIDLERHLLTCERCRTIAAQQKELWHALEVWKPEPVSVDFDEKLRVRITEDAQTTWWQRLVRYQWSWTLRPAIPVAAASAAILVGFLIRPSLTPADKVDASYRGGVKVSIEQVERALDDMDMLKQMGLASAPSDQQVKQKI